jgi:hypothetical protein
LKQSNTNKLFWRPKRKVFLLPAMATINPTSLRALFHLVREKVLETETLFVTAPPAREVDLELQQLDVVAGSRGLQVLLISIDMCLLHLAVVVVDGRVLLSAALQGSETEVGAEIGRGTGKGIGTGTEKGIEIGVETGRKTEGQEMMTSPDAEADPDPDLDLDLVGEIEVIGRRDHAVVALM